MFHDALVSFAERRVIYMKTGWVNTGNGTWYYLNPDGDMKTGWLYDKNIWYYLNNDGSMAVNCSQDGWYLGADGAGRKE